MLEVPTLKFMCVLQVTERSLKFLQVFSPKAAFLIYFNWGLPPKEKRLQ